MTNILIHTLGCSANQGESEIMAGLLSEEGYVLVKEKELADIIIVNICTVKGDRSAIEAIEDMHNTGKRLVIAGCIPPTRSHIFQNVAPNAALINTDNLTKIVAVVQELEQGKSIQYLGRNYEDKVGLARYPENKHIGIIIINNSCNDSCSFCGVKLIKGKLISYPQEKILTEAQRLLSFGAKELWITSQDTGAYGIDISGRSLLPELVEKLIAIPGNFKIRIGMFNMMNIFGREDAIVALFAHQKVYTFAHIPVQSGNDAVLRRMKRRYTAEQYRSFVHKLRSQYPEMTIATDIITGFPGETDEEFQDTVDLVKDIQPEVMHISRYQRIPNTAASIMPTQVHGRINQQRSEILARLHPELARARLQRFVGREYCTVVTEKRKDYIAHTGNYTQIVIRSAQDILGRTVLVKIHDATKYYLVGDLIEVYAEKLKQVDQEIKPQIILRI